MNLQFWKHKPTDNVVTKESYDKLPEHHASEFEETESEPTHNVSVETDDDDEDLMMSTLSFSTLESISSDFSNETKATTDFGGFDGGTGIGGGASSDF